MRHIVLTTWSNPTGLSNISFRERERDVDHLNHSFQQRIRLRELKCGEGKGGPPWGQRERADKGHLLMHMGQCPQVMRASFFLSVSANSPALVLLCGSVCIMSALSTRPLSLSRLTLGSCCRIMRSNHFYCLQYCYYNLCLIVLHTSSIGDSRV